MSETVPRTRRGGFALLAVLWTLAAIGAVAAGTSMVAREAVGSARNQMSYTRAIWLAEGCTERMRERLDRALEQSDDDDRVRRAWIALDRLGSALPDASTRCAISFHPIGADLDVNRAGDVQLRRFFSARGLSAVRSDTLTDVLLDWRDGDDEARPAGAERDWYLKARLGPPRNGNLADDAELARLRGFMDFGDSAETSLMAGLGVEGGRVDLSHAPPSVLASLPGFGPATIGRIGELQAAGQIPRELLAIAAELPVASRDSLTAHYGELATQVRMEPAAWLLTVRVAEGEPRVVAVLELRLARANRRVAVTRRREWVE